MELSELFCFNPLGIPSPETMERIVAEVDLVDYLESWQIANRTKRNQISSSETIEKIVAELNLMHDLESLQIAQARIKSNHLDVLLQFLKEIHGEDYCTSVVDIIEEGETEQKWFKIAAVESLGISTEDFLKQIEE